MHSVYWQILNTIAAHECAGRGICMISSRQPGTYQHSTNCLHA